MSAQIRTDFAATVRRLSLRAPTSRDEIQRAETIVDAFIASLPATSPPGDPDLTLRQCAESRRNALAHLPSTAPDVTRHAYTTLRWLDAYPEPRIRVVQVAIGVVSALWIFGIGRLLNIAVTMGFWLIVAGCLEIYVETERAPNLLRGAIQIQRIPAIFVFFDLTPAKIRLIRIGLGALTIVLGIVVTLFGAFAD